LLTFDQLDVLPDSVVEIYERYQLSVIKKIAEKLATLNYAAAVWQVERLNQSAMLYDDILAQLAEVTGQSEKELQKIFKKAGVKTIAFEDSIYRQAGLKPMPFNQSPAMLEVLRVGLDKTKWTLRNIINTTAVTGQNAFIDAADLAYMQVSTGTMSYTEAIRDAVKSIADDGLRTIQYAGRSDQLDVAVRRAVLTGIGNTAAELQLKRAAEMGQDLIQMSAHVGARPTHQVWQGKVFSISGTSDKYPPFVESTGYGTVMGYAGINCVLGDTIVVGVGKRAIYRRKYTGKIITIRTSTGKELSITPNHPILTDKGWVIANLLNVGDNVISRTRFNGIAGISPNIDNKKASIQNIFDSFLKRGYLFRLPASAGYFHGDISKGEIDTVFPNRFLRNKFISSIFQHNKNVVFGNTPKTPDSLSTNGIVDKILFCSNHSTNRVMRGFGKCLFFFLGHSFQAFVHCIRAVISKWHTKFCEILSYRTFGDSRLCCNLVFPHTRFIHREQFVRGDAGLAPQIKFPIHFPNAITRNTIIDCTKRAFISIGNGLHGLTSKVTIDNIVFIERKSTQGSFVHVYNLETKNGWYFANGIITHNCRHSAYPYFEGISENAYKQADLDSYASKTATYNGKEMDYYEATQKQRYFERGIRKWKREAEALAAAGKENGFELSKVKEWQGRMRDFTKQTGLYRQREREQI